MTPGRIASGMVGLVLVLVSLGACSEDPVEPPKKLDALPRDLSVAEREVVRASNDFAFDLLREVVAREEAGANVFLSPLSASMALGMTLNGAAGGTFEGIRTALALDGMTNEEINEAYQSLMDLLPGLDPAVEMQVANSTWAREGFSFEPAFFETVQAYFDAEARELDFDDPGARDVINEWVRERTDDRIESIVDHIGPLDILFLVNAVYFEGEWTHRFDPSLTGPRPFQVGDAEGAVEVETMVHPGTELAIGGTGEGGTVGELPYGAQAFTLVVALPPPEGSVDELVSALDAALWVSWMDGLEPVEDGRVELPKLELDYDVRLDEPLEALGMSTAFDPLEADFSRLTQAQDAHISRVKHKTFLKVDEEGTEAAASTSVGVGVTSLPPGLVVNCPFVLAIRERFSGAILFLGVIRDPR